MTNSTTTKERGPAIPVLTEELILGTERRWRRFSEVVPAGRSLREDGSPDYGLFGPGSVIWEVLLHPATAVFESAGQGTLQNLYKPIIAGFRDGDPISRKARAGTFTKFDMFDRLQRNSGMHAPMWLGDTATATAMADHLHRIHGHVTGPIIDPGTPELGGYDAAGPRDAMWAAITELYGTMLAYEHLAWHGDEPPRPLTPAQRDQFILEMGAYLRLVGANEEEIPTNMAELELLFDKYWDLFGITPTLLIDPETGVNLMEQFDSVAEKNWHPSHQLAVDVLDEAYYYWATMMFATVPVRFQEAAGLDEAARAACSQLLEQRREEIRQIQQPENELRLMRLLWGPDGVELIHSARELHAAAGGMTAA